MSKRVADNSIHAAALSAAALIAHQLGGKATRDTLFLTHFQVSALAWMVMIASVLSIVIGIAAARLLSRTSPRRVIPRTFAASAILLLITWGLSFRSPALAAVLVYVQIAALGSALISGFWSLLSDHFDPRTARKRFGRVVAASTFGGMIGGLLAERIGTTFGVTTMLPVLAALDLFCALLTASIASVDSHSSRDSAAHRRTRKSIAGTAGFTAFGVLRNEAYLRYLALLVVLTTISAGLLDYVFKARAVAVHQGGADLVRFFAIFYTAVGVITFVVQIALSRISLEKIGLAGTIGSLPFAITVGAFGGMIPVLSSAVLARGSENVLRSSLFRSGYELFFTAVPRVQRRKIKPILDIGFDRFGDLLGGVLISTLLIAGSSKAIPLMLGAAALNGI